MKNKYDLKLGIVIIGYTNAVGMKRLLSSLDNVDFGYDELVLIFSIDYSGKTEVTNVANEYKWLHGKKIVKAYTNNLGLRTHILKCGDYIEEYNLDALIVLEDDIYLSPNAYLYALETVKFYKNDEKIAGISLYKHEFNLNAKHPFLDLEDGYDTFFIQYAQSWGQVWLKEQWRAFKRWYEAESWKELDQRMVPNNLKKWTNSWLKYHIMYCISTNKYFVYPRVSLTTDFSDAGVHGSRQNTDMQVPLDYSTNREWKFAQLCKSKSVYDAFFQNIYVKQILDINDVLIDYYGIRDVPSNCRYLLSVKPLGYKVIRSWGLQLRPVESNIISNINGDDIFLYDLSKQQNSKKKQWAYKVFEYDLKGLNIVSFHNIKYCFYFLIRYFNIKVRKLKKRLYKNRKK